MYGAMPLRSDLAGGMMQRGRGCGDHRGGGEADMHSVMSVVMREGSGQIRYMCNTHICSKLCVRPNADPHVLTCT